MHSIYTKTIVVQSTDTDLYGNLRPCALLQYFQSLGIDHANLLGMSRESLVETHHASWILARVWFRLYRPIHAEEALRIDTWHREITGVTFYRDYDLYIGEEHVGEGVSAWVIADIATRKMLFPETIESVASSKPPQRVFSLQLRPIRNRKDKAPVYERTVRYSDLDVNGHMNNTKYADVLLDAFTPEELRGRFIGEMQLNYSQECLSGDTMVISRADAPDSCYIDGCSPDGTRRFEATVQFREVSGKILDEVKESE